MSTSRTLDDVLQSTSDVLYPDRRGAAPVSIDSIGSDGDTALHVLLWRGDSRGAALLIEAGADVNAAGDMDETPLHVALRKENLALSQLLIRSGARLDARSELMQTPRELAKALGGEFARLVDMA